MGEAAAGTGNVEGRGSALIAAIIQLHTCIQFNYNLPEKVGMSFRNFIAITAAIVFACQSQRPDASRLDKKFAQAGRFGYGHRLGSKERATRRQCVDGDVGQRQESICRIVG